ncbi:MAG: hypothetical protein LC126_20920 [Bryobacterales bacterium]|nr:hypothetical protein [Bryobacterales bacterium]
MYPTITSGCALNPLRFCPDDPLPRWQMAMFVIRAIYGGDSFTYSTNPYFNDVPRFDQYGNPVMYFPHVQRMYELGITTGCATPGAYCPFDSTLNYMAAVFTVRAAQYKAGNPLYIDPSVSRPDTFADIVLRVVRRCALVLRHLPLCAKDS